MPIDKIIIAATPEEQKDRSYMEYLALGAKERTEEQARKTPKRETSKLSKKDISGTLKEYISYRNRKRENVNRKYF